MNLSYNLVQSESIFWVWLPVLFRFTVLFHFLFYDTLEPSIIEQTRLWDLKVHNPTIQVITNKIYIPSVYVNKPLHKNGYLVEP